MWESEKRKGGSKKGKMCKLRERALGDGTDTLKLLISAGFSNHDDDTVNKEL